MNIQDFIAKREAEIATMEVPDTFKRRPLMTDQEVRDVIVELEVGCKNKATRKRMAEHAVRVARVTTEGRAVWVEYLATFK